MEAWYAAADMLPPLRVLVRVMWIGREFDAVRLMQPKRRRIGWQTIHNGDPVYLPPKGRDRIWGHDPELWRPIDPANWPHALPEPRTLLHPAWPPVSQDVSRETRLAGSAQNPLDPLWWRDITLVSRSPEGDVSRLEAEGRIMRALNVNWAVRMERPQQNSNAAVIARMSAEKLAVEIDEPILADWRPPFEPLGLDYDDFLAAMAWFAALNPPELWHKRRKPGSMNRAQLVLLYRAMDPPSSWRFIGDQWSVSAERARQIFQSSIDKVHRAANGKPVYKHVRVENRMALVREQNKRHANQNSA